MYRLNCSTACFMHVFYCFCCCYGRVGGSFTGARVPLLIDNGKSPISNPLFHNFPSFSTSFFWPVTCQILMFNSEHGRRAVSIFDCLHVLLGTCIFFNSEFTWASWWVSLEMLLVRKYERRIPLLDRSLVRPNRTWHNEMKKAELSQWNWPCCQLWSLDMRNCSILECFPCTDLLARMLLMLLVNVGL